MTNEEAIEELESAYSDNVFRDGEYEACRIAINSIQENTKLKADVEQFSNELISVLIENELLKKKNELTNYYFEQYSAAIDEVEKLKEDYEQLKISDASKEQSSIDYYNLYRQALNEVKQLKAELEQSVKLPCKVGDKIYLLDFKENKYDEATVEEFVFTRDGKIEINSDYEIGTWSEDEYVKYSKESAERELKGKVEK